MNSIEYENRCRSLGKLELLRRILPGLWCGGMVKNLMIDRHSFENGKIVLYRLEGRPKGYFNYRIKVPNGKGYKVGGTGTDDLYEARKQADQQTG